MAAIQFDAQIHMSADAKIIVGENSWAPNLLVEGSYYPGRIISVSKLLRAGEEGAATLGILVNDGDKSPIKSGIRLELRDGPLIKVADATAI